MPPRPRCQLLGKPARESFKLDGHRLTAQEQAGQLAQLLGGVEPALRLVSLHRDMPGFCELKRPRIANANQLVDVLAAPTRAYLTGLLPTIGPDFDAAACQDPHVHAAVILAATPSLGQYLHVLDLGLYSFMHEAPAFVLHPAATDTLFILNMVLWRDRHPA